MQRVHGLDKLPICLTDKKRKPLVLRFIKNMVQLIFAPARGWEDLAAEEDAAFADMCNSDGKPADADLRPDWEENESNRMFRFCFLPFIAVCACSSFVKLFYGGNYDWLMALQAAIITFVSLFLSSQFARYVFQLYMPRITGTDAPLLRGRWMNLVMFCVAFLGLIQLVSNIIKVKIALIEFLPLYAMFIIWKGCRYVGVDERNVGLFMIMATLSILGSTYLVTFLLNALI